MKTQNYVRTSQYISMRRSLSHWSLSSTFEWVYFTTALWQQSDIHQFISLQNVVLFYSN